MRNPDRIPLVLEEVEKLWRLHPDWRLGQLLCNLAAWANPDSSSPWDLEEDELIDAIHRHLAQNEPASTR